MPVVGLPRGPRAPKEVFLVAGIRFINDGNAAVLADMERAIDDAVAAAAGRRAAGRSESHADRAGDAGAADDQKTEITTGLG